MVRTKTTTPEPPGDNAAATPAVAASKPAPATAPDGHTAALLRCFSAYPSLYIDRQGGVFTPCTAPHLREGAVLYENPYYEPNKTNR